MRNWIPSQAGNDKQFTPMKSGMTLSSHSRLHVIPAEAGIQEKMNHYYVYILASKRNGTLYVGVTNNLERRVYEHKQGLVEGFTKKYGVHTLVYLEDTADVKAAIAREKQIKKWNRAWKLQLIEKTNPDWNDLAAEWFSNQPLDET